jgi:hypothetical protein
MVMVFMISRLRRKPALIAALLGFALSAVACNKVPLLAPSGSSIIMTSAATTLPINGSADIIAQVLEASGTPPQDGTLVTFTTTLGSVQPSQAETSGGRVVVKFNAGAASGSASIVATSGGASVGSNGAIKILIGTAAVGRVIASANPTLVPALGGSTVITAVIIDVNGNPLGGVPVTFSTTAGSLADVLVNADQNGLAQTTLRTSTSATVTASVGATAATPAPTTGTTTPTTGTTSGQASATVTVGIASSPTLVITPPTTTPTVGLPATFTFAVTAAATNGSTVRDVTVNWGDSSGVQDLGAITGTASIAHVFRSAGSFTIAASVTDSSGNVVPVSSFVTVLAPVLSLTITPPATTPSANLPANFTFAATAPTGDAVRDVSVIWGDGSPSQDLGAVSASAVVTHVFKSAGTYNVSGTVTDQGGSSSTSSTSVTVIPVPRPAIVITSSAAAGHVTTVTVAVTLANGLSVQDLTIAFGDGQTNDLGGATSASIAHFYANIQVYTVTVTVLDSSGQVTVGTGSVTVSP